MEALCREQSQEDLLVEFSRTRDQGLRNHLIVHNLGLVRFIANKFVRPGILFDDLMQEGAINLIHAVDKFDPSRGTKFSTFAMTFIVGAIKHYLRDKGRTIKIAAWVQELGIRITKASETLTVELKRTPTVPEIAEAVGLTQEATTQVITSCDNFIVISSEQLIQQENGSEVDCPISFGVIDKEIKEMTAYGDLYEAIGKLSKAEKQVIELLLTGVTQTEVARQLDVLEKTVQTRFKRAKRKLGAMLQFPTPR